MTEMNMQVYQQLQQIEQHLQHLAMQIQELTTTAEALHELKGKQEILVPITAGVYTKATLDDMKEVIINVGANTAVPKTIEEALALIDRQKREMASVQEQLTEQFEQLQVQLQNV